MPAEPVRDYALHNADGSPTSLSALFGSKDEMLLIHNMGRRCVYCTLWADGFNGLIDHFNSRVAFVLASPDEPAVLREFAASRSWRFRCVSTHQCTLAKDLGFEPEPGKVWPGVSALRRTSQGIARSAYDHFGPGDAYCSIWNLLDLLPEGARGWEPRYSYHESPAEPTFTPRSSRIFAERP